MSFWHDKCCMFWIGDHKDFGGGANRRNRQGRDFGIKGFFRRRREKGTLLSERQAERCLIHLREGSKG